MSASSRFLRRSALLNVLFAIEGGSMFFLDVALAAALGLGARSDSLYAAWSLPLTIGRGAFQSLTNSLIGLFAESDDDRVAFSQAVTVVGLTAFSAALFMSLTSRWWFPLSVPGAAVETKLAGAPLAAILSWLIAILALAETQRAIFYRINRNLFPSLLRVLGAITSIAIILFPANQQNLRLVAFGLVIGALVELLLGSVSLMALGQRINFSWPTPDRLKRMARIVGLPLLGQGVFIAASTSERALASFLGPGAVTAVAYANRIFQMLERFVFRGFVIATIQSYAAALPQKWRRDTRLLLLLSVPLMVIFAVLPTAVITLVFERGQFTAEATQLVSLALRSYAFAIPVVALNRIPYALAFAQNKSRELLIYAVIFALTLIGVEFLLINLGLGVAAFGMAQLVALSLGTFWLYRQVMTREEMPPWSAEEVSRLLGVGLFALAGTALVVIVVQAFIADPIVRTWVVLVAGGSGSLLLTAAAIRLFRLPEVEQFSRLLKRAGY